MIFTLRLTKSFGPAYSWNYNISKRSLITPSLSNLTLNNRVYSIVNAVNYAKPDKLLKRGPTVQLKSSSLSLWTKATEEWEYWTESANQSVCALYCSCAHVHILCQGADGTILTNQIGECLSTSCWSSIFASHCRTSQNPGYTHGWLIYFPTNSNQASMPALAILLIRWCTPRIFIMRSDRSRETLVLVARSLKQGHWHHPYKDYHYIRSSQPIGAKQKPHIRSTQDLRDWKNFKRLRQIQDH